jgi:hypothetical protein
MYWNADWREAENSFPNFNLTLGKDNLSSIRDSDYRIWQDDTQSWTLKVVLDLATQWVIDGFVSPELDKKPLEKKENLSADFSL